MSPIRPLSHLSEPRRQTTTRPRPPTPAGRPPPGAASGAGVLDHFAALHDEGDAVGGVEQFGVVEGVAGEGDDVGPLALGDAADLDMTLRYAHLASSTIRSAYDTAIAQTRPKARLVARADGQFVPDRVDWLHSEWLKTRVAHGFCSRHPAAGACPYANICEQCNNFVPDPDRREVIAQQLADVIVLRDDATGRGWDDENRRHQHVIDALDSHLHRIDRNSRQGASS